MERTACVDLPEFPLQLLLRRHPEWRRYPVVVVDRDKPTGLIEWANEHARAHRIVPGMRYASGLALSRQLRGDVVSRSEIDCETNLILERLWLYSPRVEPSRAEPGIFWMDASGMRHLYESLGVWAKSVTRGLRDAGL